MSRVDEALKIAEGGGSAASPAPPVRDDDIVGPRAADGSPLQQYRPEGAETRRENRAAPQSTERVQPFRPVPSARRGEERARLRLDSDDLRARLVTDTSSTVSLEQYRKLAAVLHEEQAEGQIKTLMITSALPHEGKTLTVVNLALTLSESYARRVLVIDADLRCPSLHTVLGIPNERGLSEALRDEHRELPFTSVSTNLTVLTAGRPGLKPLAGLTSGRMEQVLQECAARFDWVLIDTSPVGVLPDAQVLARLVGGIILVIGAGSTPAAAVERAVAELGGPDAIIGTVLNRVEQRRIPDAGYYGQYGTTDTTR